MTRLIGLCGAVALTVAAAASAQEVGPQETVTEGPAIPAQLVAARQTVLSSELAAKIDTVGVEEGERFAAGDVLVSFDCTIQRAQLAEARALLSAADKTRKALGRLLELKSIGTLEAEKAMADAAVAEAKLALARAVVEKCTITAPFAGRVAERKVEAHQYVQAGQPMLDILDDGSLEAEFIVPSAWVPDLKVGQPLRITVAETGGIHDAQISRIGARIDAVSHSVKVVAVLKGSLDGLVAGMTGRVRMTPPVAERTGTP